jgi:hypothetical protein
MQFFRWIQLQLKRVANLCIGIEIEITSLKVGNPEKV